MPTRTDKGPASDDDRRGSNGGQRRGACRQPTRRPWQRATRVTGGALPVEPSRARAAPFRAVLAAKPRNVRLLEDRRSSLTCQATTACGRGEPQQSDYAIRRELFASIWRGWRIFFQARATGIEPATTGSTIRYSNQLSYAPEVYRTRQTQFCQGFGLGGVNYTVKRTPCKWVCHVRWFAAGSDGHTGREPQTEAINCHLYVEIRDLRLDCENGKRSRGCQGRHAMSHFGHVFWRDIAPLHRPHGLLGVVVRFRGHDCGSRSLHAGFRVSFTVLRRLTEINGPPVMGRRRSPT